MIDTKQILKIKDFPLDERPRERLFNHGVKALTNAELLAIILNQGSRNVNVVDLSKNLFRENNLLKLSRKRLATLKKYKGIGQAKASKIVACFELGRRLASFKMQNSPTVDSAHNIAAIYMPEMSSLKKENFKVVFLDTRRQIITDETVFVGTLNTSIIHPREIFRAAVNENSAAIILIHNHPSGNPEPSEDDMSVTEQISKAGKIMGIEVIDHIIIGNNSFFSFKENDFL